MHAFNHKAKHDYESSNNKKHPCQEELIRFDESRHGVPEPDPVTARFSLELFYLFIICVIYLFVCLIWD